MPPHASRQARGDRTRAALVAAALDLFGHGVPVVERGCAAGTFRTDLSPRRLAHGASE